MTVNSKYVEDEGDNDADATVLTAALFPPEAPLLVEAEVVLKAREDVPAKFPAASVVVIDWFFAVVRLASSIFSLKIEVSLSLLFNMQLIYKSCKKFYSSSGRSNPASFMPGLKCLVILLN